MKSKRSFVVVTAFGILGILFLQVMHVGATGVRIEEDLSVTPNVISFETVFPQEVLFRPLNIGLASSYIQSMSGGGHDRDNKKDPAKVVEYRIVQKPKPRIESNAEREYCASHPNDFSRCYPSLCPYLSKEPDESPKNDKGVPAFHDPNASSSIAYGTLSKKDDPSDQWTIDLHVPCFRGECDQSNDIPVAYRLDPALHGQKFGCDLVVETIRREVPAKAVTRSQGFWMNHTAFTSAIFASSTISGTMNVGTPTHVRVITNNPGNGQSRLFGAYFSNVSKKTNNAARTQLDKARMILLPQLVSAKLNCAAFGCSASTTALIASADAAYASGTNLQMLGLATQLKSYNESGDASPIPSPPGPSGSATPATSQSRANKVFWNNP